jgi:lipopolysaccharide transport system ATP-binding protein
MPESMDVEKLMQNAREQFERGSTWDQAIPHASPRTAPDVAAIARANRSLRFRKSLVGQIPPAPSTLRARASGVLVKMISRSLFWFTGRLDDFHSSVVEASDVQSAALTSLAWSGQQTKQLLDRVQGQLQELSAALTAETAARVRAEQALSAGVDGSARKLRVLEAGYRRLEIAQTRSHSARNPMAQEQRHWEIGICGAFDAANYGDLLFPLIAEAELRRRLGDITLRCFSCDSKGPPAWPCEVTALSELPEMLPNLDGLLIGGASPLRFEALDSSIHHPASYWLSPALMALQQNVPLAWNSPGISGNVPDWARPLLEIALELSPYVRVRDELSQAALQPFSSREIGLVPDPTFGLPNLLDLRGAPSPEFARITKAYGLQSPYIVFQPNPGFEPAIRMIRNQPERFENFQFLILPVSPEFAADSTSAGDDLPRAIRLDEWPDPLVIGELIGRSDAAVGDDLQFNISALGAGVPVFRFAGLQDFETIFLLPREGCAEADWFLARVGRRPPSGAAVAALEALDHHWNRIAAIFQQEKPQTGAALSRFWQSLPSLLENAGQVPARPAPSAGLVAAELSSANGSRAMGHAG